MVHWTANPCLNTVFSFHSGAVSQGPRAAVESSLPAEASLANANAEPLLGPAAAAPAEELPPAEMPPPSAASGRPHDTPAPTPADALVPPPGLPPPVQPEGSEGTTAAAAQPDEHKVCHDAKDVRTGGGPSDAAPPPAESAATVAPPAPATAPAATATPAAETPQSPAVKTVWGKPVAVSPGPLAPAQGPRPAKAGESLMCSLLCIRLADPLWEEFQRVSV